MPEEDINIAKPEVEKEDVGESVISKPYDPEKIRIDHQSVNLGTLLEMLEFDEIDLMPDFQREADLWNSTKKSQLIESILLGLPLPSFYFSVDKKTNKWLVVDGLQRLSTFKAYCIDKTLALTGLEFLSDYETKTYDQLSRADYRKISGFKVNQYVIDKNTPPEVKFLIFKRVNTGGLILTPQEMRHALNQGVAADFIRKLSKLEEFKKATDYKISPKRQEDRDFVNRFVAFYLLGYDENYEGELDNFLNDAMGQLDGVGKAKRTEIEYAFSQSMKTCYNIFGNDCFRKRYYVGDSRKPISKSVYDTISVNVGWLDDNQRTTLVNSKENFKKKLIALFNEDAFNSAVSFSTGQKQKVTARFGKIKNLINELIDND